MPSWYRCLKMLPVGRVNRHSHTSNGEPEHTSASENSPLLHRFPGTTRNVDNFYSSIIISLLFIVLITGAIIGVYLLIVQKNSENVLPPVNTALQLVTRNQWDKASVSSSLQLVKFLANLVVVVQTDTEECYTLKNCTELLKEMLTNLSDNNTIPYNFLISTNGQTYEGLGWRTPSTLFPALWPSLVLAFIGNYTNVPPSSAQTEELRNILDESVSQHSLAANYSIVVKNTESSPIYLLDIIKTFPNWNKKLSDA